jgi:CRISPR/Cas system CMR-associated protein Cmr3 (group 5 of RAMP superfamily)
MTKIEVTKNETIKRWDYVQTFRPPPSLSIENGRIYKIEKLNQNSPDYELVANSFLSTFGGANAGVGIFNPLAFG